jgi:hypothetical protein
VQEYKFIQNTTRNAETHGARLLSTIWHSLAPGLSRLANRNKAVMTGLAYASHWAMKLSPKRN